MLMESGRGYLWNGVMTKVLIFSLYKVSHEEARRQIQSPFSIYSYRRVKGELTTKDTVASSD